MHTSVSNPCTPRHPLSWATTKAVIVGALQRCCNVCCNVARYTDVVMKSELLAACVPIYDPLETSDLSVLLGVACMDLNMLVDLDTIRRRPDYQVRCTLAAVGRGNCATTRHIQAI